MDPNCCCYSSDRLFLPKKEKEKRKYQKIIRTNTTFWVVFLLESIKQRIKR